MPAVAAALKNNGIKKRELDAVLDGLAIVRDGSFFKWKNDFWTQTSGCALGDVDSCSYTDIAMAHLLNTMIPATERALSITLELFKIYRDDGLGVIFGSPSIVLSILEFFNGFNDQIQWTRPQCAICHT